MLLGYLLGSRSGRSFVAGTLHLRQKGELHFNGECDYLQALPWSCHERCLTYAKY